MNFSCCYQTQKTFFCLFFDVLRHSNLNQICFKSESRWVSDASWMNSIKYKGFADFKCREKGVAQQKVNAKKRGCNIHSALFAQEKNLKTQIHEYY